VGSSQESVPATPTELALLLMRGDMRSLWAERESNITGDMNNTLQHMQDNNEVLREQEDKAMLQGQMNKWIN
jgi:hypothetical protein